MKPIDALCEVMAQEAYAIARASDDGIPGEGIVVADSCSVVHGAYLVSRRLSRAEQQQHDVSEAMERWSEFVGSYWRSRVSGT